MIKRNLDKMSAVMTHTLEQLKHIEEELLYMSAVKAFYPTEEEKTELSAERIAAMDVIIKYQTDLTKRLEKAKIEAQRQFDWAKEEYLNLIEQLQQCQQDTEAMALEIDKSSEMPPDVNMSEITEEE